MKIAVLCQAGLSTDLLLSSLARREACEIVVLQEARMPRKGIIKLRLRRLGLAATLGQVAFMLTVPRLQARAARRRINALLAEFRLTRAPTTNPAIEMVDTVNDPAVIERLRAFAPNVVLVNGTRIIKKAVLDAISTPFINVHAGITPKYRGVHGGYWALYHDDLADFGSTIHLVDKGVDTGRVLAHVRSAPTLEDSFSTYPLVQYLSTLPVLEAILDDLPTALASSPEIPSGTPSRQWYHPTLLQYVRGLMRGVK